jgi:hypothetical protein
MSYRSFQVMFNNATHSKLFLVMNDGQHTGAFSIAPPAMIAPNSKVTWKTESNSLLQGTDGFLFYQFDGTGEPVPERVRFAWASPWLTSPEADGDLHVATGQFEDRKSAGGSHPDQGILAQSAAHTFFFDGPWPVGTHPGPINTDGWPELIPGYIAFPFDPFTNAIDDCVAFYTLTDQGRVPEPLVSSFGQQAGVRTLEFVPAERAPAPAWHQTYVFPDGYENAAKVRVALGSVSFAGGIFTTVQHSMLLALELKEDAGTSSAPTFSINSPTQPVVYINEQTYRGDAWPPRAAPEHHGSTSVRPEAASVRTTAPASSASAAALPANLVSAARQSIEGTPARRRLAAAALAPSGSPLTPAGRLAGQVSKLKPIESAAGLLPGRNITLMLYSAHIAATGEPLGYGLRYLRKAVDGTTLVDLMLSPALPPVH